MNHLTTLIIDDEKHAREALATLLDLYCPNVKILTDAGNMEDGIRLIHQHKPDLVFLDIEIGENNGFELLDQLSLSDFQLIFTTGHREFALKAFRYHAIDYLLKPIEPQQLVTAVEKVSKSRNNQQLQQQLDHLFQSLPSNRPEKLVIPTMEGLHFIEVGNIIQVAGSASYSTFHLENGEKIMASKNLKHFEDLLPQSLFFRAHQSHLVNIRFIKMINTQEGSMIELKDGGSVPLARRRKEELLALIRR